MAKGLNETDFYTSSEWENFSELKPQKAKAKQKIHTTKEDRKTKNKHNEQKTFTNMADINQWYQ